MSRYDKVPMTEESLSGMSLNPYDQLWLKRLFDLNEKAIKEIIVVLIKKIEKRINDLEKRMDKVEQRVDKLEKIA